MKRINILFAFCIVILLATLVAATTITQNSPEDGSYDLDGSNIIVNATVSPTSGNNITNISLWVTNPSGTWSRNSTIHYSGAGLTGTARVVGFNYASLGTNQSVADGTDLYWSIEACLNTTGAISCTFSPNRTINVEYPPNVLTILGPATGNYSQNSPVAVTYNVSSIYANTPSFYARLWTNESGSWQPETGVKVTSNNSQGTFHYNFDDELLISYAVESWEGADSTVRNFSTNHTIIVDTTDPTISVVNEDNENSTSTTSISFTPTDRNLDAVIVYLGDFSVANYTNTSPNSGIEISYVPTSLSDGSYNLSVWANDSSGRYTQTDNITLIADSTAPTITITGNHSVADQAEVFSITWTTSESTNTTLYFDTDTDVSDGTSYVDTSTGTTHNYTLNFGKNTEQTYYVNITSCDAANTCSASKQHSFKSPANIYGGWNLYSVYDATINISEVVTNSSADIGYIWNQTDQSWVTHTAGTAANGGTLVGTTQKYRSVWLYENTNSTWFRNTTAMSAYHYNVSAGHNFIALSKGYSMGNLTRSFYNASYEESGLDYFGHFPPKVKAGSDYIFNITAFAGFNASAQDWTIAHTFNTSWNNDSIVAPCPTRSEVATCAEVAWVWSYFNVTWNGSAVISNWSLQP